MSAPPAPAALSNQEALKGRKLGALHQALAMYRSRLGLEFVHGAFADAAPWGSCPSTIKWVAQAYFELTAVHSAGDG